MQAEQFKKHKTQKKDRESSIRMSETKNHHTFFKIRLHIGQKTIYFRSGFHRDISYTGQRVAEGLTRVSSNRLSLGSVKNASVFQSHSPRLFTRVPPAWDVLLPLAYSTRQRGPTNGFYCLFRKTQAKWGERIWPISDRHGGRWNRRALYPLDHRSSQRPP